MDQAEILARNRVIWSARAETWDARAETNRAAPDRRAAIARIVSALALGPGADVLDAGCGTGQYALDFAALGCRVTAIDLAPAMIERARAHARDRGLDVDWLVGDLSAVDRPAASFDAVFARVALQFVPDPVAALREGQRLLRPGGRLLASVPGALSPIYADAWQRFVATDRPPLNGMMPWELERLLTHLGYAMLDGWGESGPDAAGRANFLDEAARPGLPPLLQQAAATTWTFIASA